MHASLHNSAASCGRPAAAAAASASRLLPVLQRQPQTLASSSTNRPSTSSSALPWHADRHFQQHSHHQQQQHGRRRGLALLQRTRRAAASAAAGSLGGGNSGETDPYKVLGLPPDADNNAINRAFRIKKFEARGNDPETARLEAAHSALMMAALAQRVRGGAAGGGGAAVPAEVRFADREPLFPWRPKRWDATPKVVLAMGAIQLAVAFFGIQSPQFSKIVGAGLIGVAGNVLKANAISPPPRNPETATEEESGRSGRNFVRGLLLGLMATVGGMLIFSLPEAAVGALGLALPPWVPTGPAVTLSVRIAGVAFCNWLITSFFY